MIWSTSRPRSTWFPAMLEEAMAGIPISWCFCCIRLYLAPKLVELAYCPIQLWDSACLAFHKDLRQVSISYWAGPFLQIHHFHVLLASFSFGQYVHESVRCSSEFVILKAALVLVKGCKRFVKMCLHLSCSRCWVAPSSPLHLGCRQHRLSDRSHP